MNAKFINVNIVKCSGRNQEFSLTRVMLNGMKEFAITIKIEKTCFTCKHNDKCAKGNVCKIEKNDKYNEHKIEMESGETPWLGLSIWSDLPVSMQIKVNCEYWEYVYQIEESEKE